MDPDPTFMQIFISDSVANQGRSRWYNLTFDGYWNIIDSSSDFDDVLQANFDAQQILWQEQPITVMYNNELTSMYRTDKFEGWVTVPGEGAYTR